MKATHIDFQHPGCIRVTGAPAHRIYQIGKGWHDSTELCVAPGSDLYKKLFRKGLPAWAGSPEQLAEAKAMEPPEEVSSEDSSN